MQLPDGAAARLGIAALAGAAGILCFAPFGLFWAAPLVGMVLWAPLHLVLDTLRLQRRG